MWTKMLTTRTLLALGMALAMGVRTAEADRVVLLGPAAHVHKVVGAPAKAAFTPAALADFALGALGESTGVVETVHDSVAAPSAKTPESPVLPDAFQHADAYAQVFVDAADAALLDAVAPEKQAELFHGAFALDAAPASLAAVPATIAKQLGGATIKCVGSGAYCASHALPHDDVSAAAVAKVLQQHAFLKESEAVDMTLAEELAQTQQLVDALTTADAPKPKRAFYVVSFAGVSALAQDKQASAQLAIAAQIQTLVRALQTAFTAPGVQLVAASSPSTVVAAARELEEEVEMADMLGFTSLAGSSGGSAAKATTNLASAANATANATAGNATDSVAYTDIEEYQIVLWTSLLLAAALALILVAMCNMDSHHDSLLYAKFTTSSARKYD